MLVGSGHDPLLWFHRNGPLLCPVSLRHEILCLFLHFRKLLEAHCSTRFLQFSSSCSFNFDFLLSYAICARSPSLFVTTSPCALVSSLRQINRGLWSSSSWQQVQIFFSSPGFVFCPYRSLLQKDFFVTSFFYKRSYSPSTRISALFSYSATVLFGLDTVMTHLILDSVLLLGKIRSFKELSGFSPNCFPSNQVKISLVIILSANFFCIGISWLKNLKFWLSNWMEKNYFSWEFQLSIFFKGKNLWGHIDDLQKHQTMRLSNFFNGKSMMAKLWVGYLALLNSNSCSNYVLIIIHQKECGIT